VHSESDAASTKSKKQQLLAVKKRFGEQQVSWKRHNEAFEAKMVATLKDIECNELKRMKSLQDALTNSSAFVTNYCLNRSYDVRDLTNSMAGIDPEGDLQSFMRSTLESAHILPPAPPSTYYRRISVSLKLPNVPKKVEFDYDPKTEDLSVFVRDVVDSLHLGREREALIVTAIRSKLSHLQSFHAQKARERRRDSVSQSVSELSTVSSETPNVEP